MMNEDLIKKYEDLQKDGAVLTGIVRLTQHNALLDTEILMLDLEGTKAIITRENIDIRQITTSLVNFVGKKIKFMIVEIDREAETLICSRKAVKEIEREAMVKRLEAGEVVNAKIAKLLNFGAYVDIEGVTALIRNQDFAEDYTTMKELKEVGDVIEVKLRKVSSNGRVFVEATTKFCQPTVMSLDIFEPDQVVFGVVRNVKPWGAYVCIAPNIDALCPVPGTVDLEEGMNVTFRITQVKKEEGRVRGKIIKILTE